MGNFIPYTQNILKRALIYGADDFELSRDGYAIRFTVPESNMRTRRNALTKIVEKDKRAKSLDVGSSRDGRTTVIIEFNKTIDESYINLLKATRDSAVARKLNCINREYRGSMRNNIMSKLESYKGETKIMRKRIDEEYGEFKGNPSIEFIADKIEEGNLAGYEPYEFGNWKLSAFLDSEKDMLDPYEGLSDNIIDFFAREISYPVRDGHTSYYGLDIIINSGSGLTKEDLIELMDWTNQNYYDESDIDKMLNDENEIEFWIDYEIEYDEDVEKYKEESYKGKRIMKKEINENRWATEQDMYDGNITDDEYLDTFEYIYSSLVNGNISQYKKQLRRLQSEGALKEYKAWAEEMGVDPRIVDFLESLSSSESSEPVNEGNFDQQSTAWYDFCAYVKQIMSEGHDFEEAVYDALDNTVYDSDIINIWTNLPGNLTSRDSEIIDLMREDIQEACYEEKEYIEGLDESLEENQDVAAEANAFLWDAVAEFGYRKQEELARRYPTVEEILQDSDLQISGSAKGYAQEILDYLNGKNESLEVSEISDETVDNALSKRNQAYVDASKKWVDKMFDGSSKKEQNKAWKNKEQALDKWWSAEEMAARRNARKEAQSESVVNEISDELARRTLNKRVGNSLKATDKWLDKTLGDKEYSKKELKKDFEAKKLADKKMHRANDLVARRNARKEAQSESLADSILKSAHEVLTMNESESGDLTTWQFKASGFSKAGLAKQSSFGSNDLRCTIHENQDGKLVGTVTTNYQMNKEQVEDALKEALRENGYRTSVISELINLY